jgi:protein-tyrosine-phosphatase
MKEVGIDISGQRPKQVAESLQDHFSGVVAISDASEERFPVWPFARAIFRSSLVDRERVAKDPMNRGGGSFDACAMKSAGRRKNFWVHSRRMSGP